MAIGINIKSLQRGQKRVRGPYLVLPDHYKLPMHGFLSNLLLFFPRYPNLKYMFPEIIFIQDLYLEHIRVKVQPHILSLPATIFRFQQVILYIFVLSLLPWPRYVGSAITIRLMLLSLDIKRCHKAKTTHHMANIPRTSNIFTDSGPPMK